MATKDRSELSIQAQQIRNETQEGANTAVRVGTLFQDLVDSQNNIPDDDLIDKVSALETSQTAQDEAIAQNIQDILDLESVAVQKTPQDTWILPPLTDGTIIDIGQDMFYPCVNDSEIPFEANVPKLVVLQKPVTGNETVSNCNIVSNQDLRDGYVFGLTMSAAAIGEPVKMLVSGKRWTCDTSQWVEGLPLYASSVAGEMTQTRPTSQVYLVGRVEKSDPVDGVILVLTQGSKALSTSSIELGYLRSWFTGETQTLAAGTFYKALPENRGSVLSVQQTITLNDNETLPFAQDVIFNPAVTQTTIAVGLYEAFLTFQNNTIQANERFYMEVYLADEDGTPIDSGSGLPIGIRGVPPMVVLRSPLLDSLQDTFTVTPLTGELTTPITVQVGQRLRVAVLGEKVGTQGVTKDLTIYYGSEHFTFLTHPERLVLNDLADVDTQGEQPQDILALDFDSIWKPQAGNVNESSSISRLADVASYASLTVGDILRWSGTFWQNVVNPSFLKTQYLNAFTGAAGLPVVTNPEGKIAGDLLDVQPISFVGDWTPTAGTEYPTPTAPNQTWVIVNVGAGYLFTGGGLVGQTAFEKSWIQWDGAAWLLLNNSAEAGVITTEEGLTEDKAFPTNTARKYSVLTESEFQGITPDGETLYFVV